jgi:hypothetical protein
VIIGKIHENEPTIRFNLDLCCSNCGKKVPGGITTSEKYYGTYSFLLEIDNFKKITFVEFAEINKGLIKLKNNSGYSFGVFFHTWI